MNIQKFYKTYSSDCWAGSANQVLARLDVPTTIKGRCWYRLAQGGENYSLLFSNKTDSTFSDGSISVANEKGGDWSILSMRAGICHIKEDGSYTEPEIFHTVTFEGKENYSVSSAEPFCTDPIPLHAVAGDSMCYEITLRGACYPYHQEIVLPIKLFENDKWVDGRQIPVPLMIGCDRPVTRRIGFIGDSITQGCGTAYDSYTHWVARIAEGLPISDSVWDLGIGFARTFDAATDEGWLARAKQCDIVNVCFGVNDLIRNRNASQVLGDLETLLQALKNAGRKVILFTVPPFDMEGEAKENWYIVNKAIRGDFGKKADKVFDFAAVLGQPAPREHLSVYGGHPNAEGCLLAARAYLKENIL